MKWQLAGEVAVVERDRLRTTGPARGTCDHREPPEVPLNTEQDYAGYTAEISLVVLAERSAFSRI
jgi:hypothetical protein